MPNTPCPTGCHQTRAPGQYLCRDCWTQLTPAARRQLNRRGDGAIGRLQQLYDQIGTGTPLGNIHIN